jgi:hypothetical protein
MNRRDHPELEEIRGELLCPRCEYSLRGLPGSRITCPECGSACDLAALVMRRWIGPWTRAPGYGRIVGPVGWLTIGMWPVAVAGVGELANGARPVFTSLLAAIWLAGWLLLLWRLRGFMPGGAAVGLSILAHGLFVGYLVGVVAGVALVIRALSAGPGLVMILSFAAAAVAVALLFACRRGEQFIAERCIRRHLASGGGPATAPA